MKPAAAGAPNRAAAVLAGLALCGSAAQAEPPRDATDLRLQSLAASCAQCHGTAGRALPGALIPSLAGLPPERFLREMQAFRDGARPATVMGQIARGYTPQQLQQLAGWFAARAQPP